MTNKGHDQRHVLYLLILLQAKPAVITRRRYNHHRIKLVFLYQLERYTNINTYCV